MRRATRPDALFFASDVMAIGGMDATREIGLNIPEDVSIVGYDDVPMAALPSYSLTTIRQPIREMAKVAVDMLDLGEARGKKAAPTTRLIKGTLISLVDHKPARQRSNGKSLERLTCLAPHRWRQRQLQLIRGHVSVRWRDIVDPRSIRSP